MYPNGSPYQLYEEHLRSIESEAISNANEEPVFNVPQVLPRTGGSTSSAPAVAHADEVDNRSREASGWYVAYPRLDERSGENVGDHFSGFSRSSVPEGGMPGTEGWPTSRQVRALPKPEERGFLRNKRKYLDFKHAEGRSHSLTTEARELELSGIEDFDVDQRKEEGKDRRSEGGDERAGGGQQDGEGPVPASRRDPEESVASQDSEAPTEASPGGLQFDMELGEGEVLNFDGTDGSGEEQSSESTTSARYLTLTLNLNPNRAQIFLR